MVSKPTIRNARVPIYAIAFLGLVVLSLIYFMQAKDSQNLTSVLHDTSRVQASDRDDVNLLEFPRAESDSSRHPYVIPTNLQAPHGNAVDVINDLQMIADSGDSQAALQIYLKLASCQKALQNKISDAQIEAYRSVGAAEALLLDIETNIEECAGVEGLLSQRGSWLEQAARAGSVEAQLLYAIDSEAIVGSGPDLIKNPEAVRRYKTNAMQYLHRAASGGNVDALVRIGASYNNGVLVEVDPIRAYAYYRAGQMAMPGAIPDSLISKYRSNVPVSSAAYADEMARTIYRNCCVGN